MTEKDRRKGWEGRRAKNGREVHPVKIFAWFDAAAIPHRFSNGYLLIAGITDVVAVVRILDATLVVSLLDHNSYWKDDRLYYKPLNNSNSFVHWSLKVKIEFIMQVLVTVGCHYYLVVAAAIKRSMLLKSVLA
ncbi:uncharacterized protein LOC110696920 isoform X3 [Chenopodium quinoa]|uniref:uncharacterized protein LOC110696920 isoform X3 n=1 Tax=Chenopodium quinoa TaxID=63459 RepID=UPI000B770456|nr:uncharacterized protein LOC110696920 isoform X3 [Chenopodium quinoa]